MKRSNQAMAISVGLVLFAIFCIISLTQAGNDERATRDNDTANAVNVMQVLATPEGVTADACALPQKDPANEKCKAFFNIDEDVLKNILGNYTKCLDDNSYYLDLSNQPTVALTDTLTIYGQTDDPLIIKGLKVSPADNFPKGKPPVVLCGKPVVMKELKAVGFN